MARQNPNLDKSNRNALLKPVVEGLDPLPFATGTNQDALASANAMPAVDMTPNDGGNPTIASAPFATGTDRRNRVGGSNSPPEPGK